MSGRSMAAFTHEAIVHSGGGLCIMAVSEYHHITLIYFFA